LQNIDPVLFLQPVVSVAVVVAAMLLIRRRSGFRGVMLLVSAIAYWCAIGAKTAVSYVGAAPIESAFGDTSIEFALFLGLQTVFLEVGLAYLGCAYLQRRGNLKPADAGPYGISLAFWENGVLLGVVSIVNLAVIYLIIGSGSALGSTMYSLVHSSNAGLFQAPSALLPGVLLGTLERFSSTLAHVAWGVLCVLSAVTGRKRYLGYALPMGLVDALVPFAQYNLDLFEAVVFLLSVAFILVAIVSFNRERDGAFGQESSLRRAGTQAEPGSGTRVPSGSD
jgi:hypothetical protein